MKAYDELIDFIASGTSPESLLGFKPSAELQERVRELVQREKDEIITTQERQELDDYLQLEHLMRMAKARAHRYAARYPEPGLFA